MMKLELTLEEIHELIKALNRAILTVENQRMMLIEDEDWTPMDELDDRLLLLMDLQDYLKSIV